MVQLTRGQFGTGQSSDRVSDASLRSDDLSNHSHRQLIGYIGLFIPALIIIIVLLRDGYDRWKSLDSISAYYYTGAVAAFVGMLVALALFLFTYRGYENKYYWADRAAGITAASAALGVALFPTGAPEGVPALSWWQPITGKIHFASAIVLFSMFAVYALWLFRITSSRGQIELDKRRRNTVYLICGIVIVASIVWAVIAGLNDKSIFWPESIALIAFSTSWLVKGRALKSIARTARSLLGRQTVSKGST